MPATLSRCLSEAQRSPAGLICVLDLCMIRVFLCSPAHSQCVQITQWSDFWTQGKHWAIICYLSCCCKHMCHTLAVSQCYEGCQVSQNSDLPGYLPHVCVFSDHQSVTLMLGSSGKHEPGCQGTLSSSETFWGQMILPREQTFAKYHCLFPK